MAFVPPKVTGVSGEVLPIRDVREEARIKCEAQGGKWDGVKCIMPQVSPTQTTDVNKQTPKILRTAEEKKSAQNEIDLLNAQQQAIASGNLSAKQSLELKEQQAQEMQIGQTLAGQVGEFVPGQLDSGSLFDFEQGISQGLTNFVPRAITAIGGIALLRGGAVAGGGAGAAAAGVNPYVAGAAVLGGISSSLISEFKGQRIDTIQAQKEVLTNGKSTLNSWVTMAETDPANKAKYLAEYNKVSQQIDQAYRQMKLDVSRDPSKFEKALPDLAEFEVFYNEGGERDVLDTEMRNALIQPVTTEYKALELMRTRGEL